eukprot:517435-Pleurochrysis_carterae.AAC.4
MGYHPCSEVLSISHARARADSCCERLITIARYGGAGQQPPWPLSRWRARTCRGATRSLRRHPQLCRSEVSSLVELANGVLGPRTYTSMQKWRLDCHTMYIDLLAVHRSRIICVKVGLGLAQLLTEASMFCP